MKAIKAITISLIIIISSAISMRLEAKIKISGPEFCWAMAHPFIAIKAKRISEQAIKITDSLEANGILKDRSGGPLDAFKHAYWMALLSQQINPRKAYKLGLAHEKFNYKQSRKAKGGGDKAASDMDLWNNKIGKDIGYINREVSKDSLINIVIQMIKAGDMKIIKKNANGDSLTCEGQLIDKSTLKTWVNKRCLVCSDYVYI